MKKTILILTVLAISLTACASPGATSPATEPVSAPVDNSMPVPGADVTETIVEGKMPAPSFESQTYIDEAAGFALDFPAGWTVKETAAGDRGAQSVLLSTPEIADLETLPPGATRVAVNVNQWDPKNDLDAYVAHRKVAWDASGFAITREEQLQLADGRPAYAFVVQTPEQPTFMLFTTVGQDYLQIAGDGDSALVEEIAHTVRPLS